MPVNYSVSSQNFRSDFFERATHHLTQEWAPGERYAPWIQKRHGEGDLRVAPYLPFVRVVKDFYTYAVMLAGKICGKDRQGYLVPANGILPVANSSDGSRFYEGRPLVYTATRDAGSGFGDWTDDAPVNMNPFDGDVLASADINAQGVVTAAVSTDPTAGGIAGLTFVAIPAGTMPIGILSDEALNGAERFYKKEWDPQTAMTLVMDYVMLFAELDIMRYNYGQATREAILRRDTLVGTPDGGTTAAGLDNVGSNTNNQNLDDLPFFANQGLISENTATPRDAIEAGDLVAVDDSGNPIRMDARIDDWNVAHDDASGQKPNERYPLAAMQAVWGRSHAREKVETSTPLNLVKNYQNKVLGGSGTGGVETILYRGETMAAATVTSITAQRKPATGATDNWGLGDKAQDEKFALLIRPVMV